MANKRTTKPRESKWLTLPATPTLPKSTRSGYAPINGIKIWYAVFGHGAPVILLHGGLANSNYWGNQVRALAKRCRVIVMDSRGHGRTTRDEQPFSFHLLASDVLGMMEFLEIEKTAIVGWSDGADTGLDIAIRHPDRLTKLFAFAGNTDPSGLMDLTGSAVFDEYVTRAQNEYAKLSSTPDRYGEFLEDIGKMWMSEPNFTADQLASIKMPVWIVDADHEEGVKRENTLYIADHIPGAALLIQAAVGHFSFLQDPHQFNDDVLHFLEEAA